MSQCTSRNTQLRALLALPPSIPVLSPFSLSLNAGIWTRCFLP